MSYLRWNWGLHYVKDYSRDYLFGASGEDGVSYIEDYGRLSDQGLCELLCECILIAHEEDPVFAKYLMAKMAKRLKIELRDKPLTFDESYDILQKKKCPYCVKLVKECECGKDVKR